MNCANQEVKIIIKLKLGKHTLNLSTGPRSRNFNFARVKKHMAENCPT